MSNIKIALTGAHGVGKTTLLNLLADKLVIHHDVAICREVPRIIIETVGDREFFRKLSNTPLRQMLILFYQVIEEHARARDNEYVLADRTLVDHLAYTVALFPELEKTPEFAAIMAATRAWLPEYTLIIKIPIEFAVVDDGVRESDLLFQDQIDKTIDRLYEELGAVPVVIGGSIEERLSSVLDLVNGHFLAPAGTKA